MRGFLKGIFGLALLDVALSSPAAANRTGGVFALAAKAVAWIVSPMVPAIPDRSGAGTTASIPNAPAPNPNGPTPPGTPAGTLPPAGPIPAK